MYFEESAGAGFDPAHDRGLNLILCAVSAFVVFFIILPAPVLNSAEAAAQALIK